MKKITLADRVRYAFDRTLSRGAAGLFIWLALITAILILGASFFVLLAGNDSDKDLPNILWNIMFQTITPNPVDPKAGSTTFLGVMLFSTFASLLLVSIFIGLLTNAIGQRIEHLRKGRSKVLEQDHTLVLGWSPQVFTIVSELVEANETRKNPSIVILADKDKVEMEDEIHAKVSNRRNTRVVCRTGSPLDQTDLGIVNPNTARSIIILSPEVEDPDTHVVKTLLALTNNPKRKKEPYHIVAEVHNEKNFQVAKMVGRNEAQIVQIGDLISRITVQTSREAGLSVVCTELLNFAGDEIYFQTEPALVGKQFGESLFAYEDSAVIGLQKEDGRTLLNPPMDMRIQEGDQVVAISEDDDTVKLSGLTNVGIDESAIRTKHSVAQGPEGTLILGWNSRGPTIISELDHYVAPGSQTTVVARVADVEKQIPPIENQALTFKEGDISDRRTLDALDVSSYHHIIVLSYSDMLDAQHADAQTLITLLHLRDMSERAGKEFSIVSEMLDVRNRQLADVTRADDFIVSDHLISLWLSQVSENQHLSAMFADLFDSKGTSIYLKPAQDYVRLGTPVNFYTVVEAARRRSEVAFGYRLKSQAHDAEKSYGVVVNPDKSNRVTFSEGDKVIVMALS